MDYLIIGAGPAGLQLGYCLSQANRDYLIVEGGHSAGTAFTTYPRHRKLISINKVYNGTEDAELNMRMDWNSLLSEEPSLLFKNFSKRYFPSADEMVRYLHDFAATAGLAVQYDTHINHVTRDGATGDFIATDQHGRIYRAKRLIVATGVPRPNIPVIPGIELVDQYADVSVDPEDFIDQRVLIIGKGNSAFETADNLLETAATVHVAGASPIRFAWRTHFVGHLRAVNNNFLDSYQLKSQNAVLDGNLVDIKRDERGYSVTFSFSRANEVIKELCYDRVICCTGFRFDHSIFDPAIAPTLAINDRFPAQTAEWESVNVPNLYFAGTLTQMRDYKKSTNGFIHGFRYSARALARLLDHKYEGAAWPRRTLPSRADAIGDAIIARVNRSSALWQQFGVLGDVVAVSGDGRACYYEEVPVELVDGPRLDPADDLFVVTLEYGPDHDQVDPFDTAVLRIAQHDSARSHEGQYLHPVVRHRRGGEVVATHHITENLENDWTSDEVHRAPLKNFIGRSLTSAAESVREHCVAQSA